MTCNIFIHPGNYVSNKTFGKFFQDNPSKLSSKALKRASEMAKPRAGTPHDWEDYEKYLEEMNEKSDQN